MKIEEADLKIVKELLKQYVPNAEVWVYGSRVHGKHLQKFSDLDLVIISQEPLEQKIQNLKEAFSNSNLSIMVDVTNWENCKEAFKKIIQEAYEVIQSSS